MKEKKLNEEVDIKIRQYFYSKGEKIDTSDCLFSNIESELKTRKINFSKVGLRVLAIAAAVSTIITVTAFGNIGSIKYYSYNIQTYKDRDIQKFDKSDAGLDFEPKYVMEFNNGYKLKEIDINDTFGINEFNFKCNETKNVEFLYEKDDKKMLLRAHKKEDYNSQKYDFLKYKSYPYYNDKVEDVLLRTWDKERKYVPQGYSMNEDDKKFIDADMLDIEFGDPESEVERVYMSQWSENGIEYSIYNNSEDEDLDKEVINMSRYIIENN